MGRLGRPRTVIPQAKATEGERIRTSRLQAGESQMLSQDEAITARRIALLQEGGADGTARRWRARRRQDGRAQRCDARGPCGRPLSGLTSRHYDSRSARDQELIHKFRLRW